MKKKRLQCGLTQNELSELAKIDRVYYLAIENDKYFPSVEYVDKLAFALEVSPTYIYDEYMEFISSNYGSIIRNLRENKGMNRLAFSKLLNVHSGTIKKWELEITAPSRTGYEKFKDLLQ